jgi:flagellar hook-length control protein FliK
VRPEATASAAPKPESSRKPEGGERNATPAVKPEAIGHGTDVVALHAHAEIAPRAVTVDGTATVAATQAPVAPQEAQVVADQVVRAAKLVVDDGLAQMRVDLQPPTLGGVRVEADVRGEVVVLTITAERPETQALLTQALPDIQQALVRRDVGQATVAIIGSTATPLSSDGRRAPERRPETPRERPTSHPAERRRTLRASRGVSAVDITV